MDLSDATPGTEVIYLPPYHGSTPEHGVVERQSPNTSLVFVRYSDGPQAGNVCSTRLVDLELGRSE